MCDNISLHKFHKHTEISGHQFNRIFGEIEFVKLTNAIENHNNFQFQDGLNIDTIEFNPTKTCIAGGIYFVAKKYIHRWLEYNNNTMCYMRKVTIPNDARVYIE